MLVKIITSVITLYQFLVSPFKGTTCRFHPSCSHYSLQALQRYGLLKGIRLTILRLGKCHPWHDGGYDPVP